MEDLAKFLLFCVLESRYLKSDFIPRPTSFAIRIDNQIKGTDMSVISLQTYLRLRIFYFQFFRTNVIA